MKCKIRLAAAGSWGLTQLGNIITSLVALGALAHHQQCYTTIKAKIGHQEAPKWLTGSEKGLPLNFGRSNQLLLQSDMQIMVQPSSLEPCFKKLRMLGFVSNFFQ